MEEQWHRFCEQADAGLIWHPDGVETPRLSALESILLENRGLTQHSPQTPKPKELRHEQVEFWQKQSVHKHIVADKLSQAGLQAEAEKLRNCHSYYTVAQCQGCGTVRKYPNRCDQFYCPECQPVLSRERKKQVEWWTRTIRQPKHIVLTVQNTATLDKTNIRSFRDAFTRLRKRRFTRNWQGGFYALEVTNEGKGWHLHLHALVEAAWIDSAQLSQEWKSCTRGAGRIVHVRDCRGSSYLSEVTKYAVKGVQLASWTPAQVRTFVQAFTGVRTFGVFGSLYSARTEFAEFVAMMKEAKPRCDCGCQHVRYFTEVEWFQHEHLQLGPPTAAPPRQPEPQLEFLQPRPRWPD